MAIIVILEVESRCIIGVRGVAASDEILKGTESGWDAGLGFHIKFRCNNKNPESALEDAEDPLNCIACRCMAEVEEFFLVRWPVELS